MYCGYEERFAYAAQLARQFNQRREITLDVLKLWQDLWRDLMLIKNGFKEAIINIDIEERLSRLSEETDLSDIRHFIENIQQAMQNLRRNANPRLALEVLMMDIPARKRERIGS
jgi:DNA polymerase-3 subunit delta'